MYSPIGYVLGDSFLPPAVNRLLLTPQAISVMQPMQPATGANALVPGAAALPPAVGSKLTFKNVGIGAGLAVAAYFAYQLLLPPKKSAPRVTLTPTAPAVAAVAGLFGIRLRRYRRR